MRIHLPDKKKERFSRSRSRNKSKGKNPKDPFKKKTYGSEMHSNRSQNAERSFNVPERSQSPKFSKKRATVNYINSKPSSR